MSRTVRRKNAPHSYEHGYTHEDDAEHAKLHGGWKSYRKYDLKIGKYTDEIGWYFSDVAWGGRKSVPKKGKEYDKGWWKFHSDHFSNYNSNGPGWWVTEFYQRPYRRHAKRELQKFMMDEDYEVMIADRPKLGWWD